MDQRIIDQINKLRNSTSDYLKEVSESKVPFISNSIYLSERQKFSFRGKSYPSPKINSMIFLVQNIPYTNLSTNKKEYTFQKPFYDAILDHDIFPFLLFLDKKFIKWSDITLIRDNHYSYLMIDNISNPDCIVDTIMIPYTNIEYKENVINPKDYTFLFDSDSLYQYGVIKDKIYTTISISDDDLLLVNQEMFCNTKFHIPVDQRIDINHIISFKNGLLMNHDINDYTLNVFSINDKDNTSCYYYGFIYKYSDQLFDNEISIRNKDAAIQDLIYNQNPTLFESLKERFNFKFDLSKDNETNMATALRYIMDYNSSLMSKIYKDKARILSRFYSGKALLNSVRNDGYIHLSRRIKDNTNAYIIIFKNGYLYNDYQNGIYKNKDFLFKVIDVKPDDKFEIMYILDIDNNIYNFRMYSLDDDILKIDADIDIDNMILMSPTPYNHNFENLERNDEILYTVDYEYKRIDSEHIKLILKNSFYYDKLLFMGSKRQFRYFCKYNLSDEPTYEFILPDTFKMCNNFDSYMVFLNGVFISKENYEISVFNPDDPFYNMEVYLNTPINKSDKIEVIYVGHIFKEIYRSENINTSGNILIDMSKMKYPFDKDNYIVFNNGKKLYDSELYNIDSHRFSISTSDTLSNQISIIQYIDEEEVLSSLFENNTDLLNSICNSMTEESMTRYYSRNSLNIAPIKDKGDLITKDERIMRMIKNYWLKSYINYGEEMPISIYNKDDIIIDTGNISDDYI